MAGGGVGAVCEPIGRAMGETEADVSDVNINKGISGASCVTAVSLEETNDVGRLTITGINDLCASVNSQNDELTKLLLGSRDLLKNRILIESAFRKCKEAFLKVAIELADRIEHDANRERMQMENIKESVREAVGDLLQRRLMNKDETITKEKPITYASVVGRSEKVVAVSKNLTVDVPNTTSIFIIPDENNVDKFPTARVTRDTVYRVVKPSECGLRINRVSLARKNGIKVEASHTDLKKLKENGILKKEGLKVVDNIKLCPRIIIHGIPVEMSTEEIRDGIIMQNLQIIKDPFVKIVYKYPVKSGKNYVSCIVEVSPRVRELLLKNNNVYLGFSACRCADHVRVLQCFRCSGFGHLARDCESRPACAHCAGEHEQKDCRAKDKSPVCANCIRVGGGRGKEVSHEAWDVRSCPILRRRVADKISNIDYGS